MPTATRPWLEIVATPTTCEEATARYASEPSSWRAVVDARCCTEEQEFFRVMKSKLELPDYFGFNWDAFRECFEDLLDISEGGMGSAFGGREGRPTDKLDLVINHTEHLLERETDGGLAILVHILRRATRAEATYGRRHATLHAVMCCADSAFDHFMERLRAAGVSDSDLVNGH